jgi:hypothetical protein
MKEKRQKKQSAARQVFSYLDTHPYARQSMVMGIANLSSLARRIKNDLASQARIGAIKAALRRYAGRKEVHDYEKDLSWLFRQTKLSIKNKASVFLLKPEAMDKVPAVAKRTGGDYSIISATGFSLLIISEELADEVSRIIGKAQIRQTIRSQALITLSTPTGVETSPGWVAFFTDALAKEGINVREFYSVYTETVFVLSRKDALRAYEILDKML